MHVKDICTRHVVTVPGSSSAQAVAELMRTLHVGDLVVVDEHAAGRVPLGIVTDRDLVLEVMAEEVDPNSVTAADIMSADLQVVTETDSVPAAAAAMANAGVRRMPVVDGNGLLVGILALDDILDLVAVTAADLARLVRRERLAEDEERA